MDPQKLIDYILNDPIFRQQLLADPVRTLRANGVEPTQEILLALEGIDDAALQALAQGFGNNKTSAASC